MDRFLVNTTSLKNTSDNLRVENEKLLNILSEMEKINSESEEMIISKTGDLFKMAMKEELKREKENIMKYDTEVIDKMALISNVYNEFIDEVSKKV